MSESITTVSFDVSGKLKKLLYDALPWIAFAVAFIGLNHAADTQTLATATGTGNPSAMDKAQFLWMIIVAACGVGLLTAFPASLMRRVLLAVVSVGVAILPALFGPEFLLPFLAVPIALIGVHAYFSIKNRMPWRPGLFAAGLLTLILGYAAAKRQEIFPPMMNTPIDPDFESYMQFAQTTVGWATYYREPFYIWVLKLVDFLGGELNPVMIRLTGVATGLAAAAAIFELCRRHLNLIVAVIAAVLYAGLPYMVYTSARGLREDTIVCTSMLFISMGWGFLRGPVSWKMLTLWGFLGAACSLLRISSLSFVVVTVAGTALYRFFRDIKSWRLRASWLIPIGITIALMTPYLVYCKQEYNDPFFVVNYAARYYANQEFGGVLPDFPTREELAKDAYAGPRITPKEYIFKYHSMGEIVERTWEGFEKTFFGLIFKVAYNLREWPRWAGLLYVLHFIGIALLLFPRRIYLVALILLFHGPIFFLAAAKSFDPRLLTLAMTFAYITVASAIGLGLGYGFKFLRNSSENGPEYGSRVKKDSGRKSKPTRQEPGRRRKV